MGIIGIDLGTTTSEVAFVNKGEAVIIPNIEELNTTVIPSVVFIEDNEIRVGINAKNQMILKPKNTVCEVKRVLGVKDYIEINNTRYSPTEILSFILKKIKSVAEFYLGEIVDEAVITVPANFNDTQRRQTKKAGELAGLKVDRIINEPTAAAIAYGIHNLDNDELILVYDFGGGTFDVSILELSSGILDVKCSRGDNSLGGKDIDEIMIDLIVNKFYEKTNIKLDKESPRVLNSLKKVAEQGKVELSTSKKAEIICPYITVINNEPIDLDVVIYRNEFEDSIKNIIKRTEELIDQSIQSAKVKYSDINKVILVGGSTRMPIVRDLIEKKFTGKIVSGLNPEETIALGAAIQGQIKNGLEKRIIITDASSYTLGIEVINKEFDPIISRDAKLPTEVTKSYITVEDNQKVATINVYQGESNDIRKNTFITSFDLEGLPPSQKGDQRIDVTFRYNLNGMLEILATIVTTGKVVNKKVNIENFDENIEEDKDIEVIIEKDIDKDSEDNCSSEQVNNVVNENIDVEEGKGEEHEEYQHEVKKVGNEIEETVEDRSEEAINEGIEEEEEEELTEEQIYKDTVNLTQYINSIIDNFEKEVQTAIRDDLSDLLKMIRSKNLKEARKIQFKILSMIPENV